RLVLPSIFDLSNFLWILIIALGTLVDEIGHSLTEDKPQTSYLIRKWFRYRWSLRFLVVLLAFFSVIHWWIAVGLWVFDIGYYLGEHTFELVVQRL
ncbi:MAG: hypothetical protein ACTSVM_04640, partial [Candidatus Ranarchaeia archaeon]